MKGNYGNLENLKKMQKNKKLSYTKEQLLDEKLKNEDGESNIEVSRRMSDFFNDLINSSNSCKSIAVISHGAAIKFYLSKFCTLNKDFELKYKDRILKINSPSVFKLKIKYNKLKDITQIY